MNAPAPTLSAPLATQLGTLLADLAKHFQGQLALLADHRAAIARADSPAIARCVARQQETALALSELEHRRSLLVRLACGKNAPKSITLTTLAAGAPADMKKSLLAKASQVRTLMSECTSKQTAISRASTSLLAHVQGLVHQIAQRLSETGTYAPRGLPAAAAAGAIDMVS